MKDTIAKIKEIQEIAAARAVQIDKVNNPAGRWVYDHVDFNTEDYLGSKDDISQIAIVVILEEDIHYDQLETKHVFLSIEELELSNEDWDTYMRCIQLSNDTKAKERKERKAKEKIITDKEKKESNKLYKEKLYQDLKKELGY